MGVCNRRANSPHWALAIFLLCLPIAAAAQNGVFTPTGSMTTGRFQHSATLLANGKVLVAGGYGGSGPVTSADLYDPVTGTFSPTGSMSMPMAEHVATLLANGKVLIVGGWTRPPFGLINAAALLYDPATGLFSSTGNMTSPRTDHTATLLPNGKVLVVGGYDGFHILASAELYDPSSGTFSPTGSLNVVRVRHSATLLQSGKVLVVGGVSLASAELYDPATGKFTPAGSMSTPRLLPVATLLANGDVLITGGYFGVSLASAELYDPTTGTFAPTGDMSTKRLQQAAALLPNGQVLVAGGTTIDQPGMPQGAQASAELYDPASGKFSPTSSMSSPRVQPTASLLPNGKVLVAGGAGGPSYAATAELYSSNRAPVADAGADQTVECGSVNGALVTLNSSASSDPDGDPITYVWKNSGGQIIGTTAIVNGVMAPLGTSTFTLTVTDNHGDSASDSVTITVRDTVAPTLSAALDPHVFWPPNHKLLDVSASLSFNDVCDASPRVVLLSLTSNEPDDGQGDGDTANDIQGATLNTDDRSFQLRAERSTKGTGRVYTATYRIRDASGNARSATGVVLVPLTNSQRQ